MGTEVLRPHDCLLRPSLALRNSKPIRRRRDSSLKRSAKPRHPAPCGGHLVVPPLLPAAEAAAAHPDEVYAGSGFVLSPSPRALPLPTFSRKKEGSAATAAAAVVDCSATRDLRRLLRLD
ncbi:hypothetical protein B296_00034248 [Ensete ventricosum]|uniref:Uncharacterized protein n=1 Tax=Ensete ventricosum TaxID=4639 RepID=A0A426XTJ7_ENSVE|nr:hypothetical protein B296_00034248 [Ensete ventricosum]